MALAKHIVPTETGLSLFGVLKQADPALVDPGLTVQLECLLDDVVIGKQIWSAQLRRVQRRRAHHRQAEGRRCRWRAAVIWFCSWQWRRSLSADACDEALCRQPGPAKGHHATARLQDIDLGLPQVPQRTCRLKKTDGETTAKDEPGPVSPAQLLYAKRIAQGKGLIIPDEAKAKAAMSAWIDANRDTKRGSRGRKTGYKPARSTAAQRRRRRRGLGNAKLPPPPQRRRPQLLVP